MFNSAFEDMHNSGDDYDDYDWEEYDDEEYECVDGVHEYSNDCFDMAAEYVDGLQECEYWEQIDCESWEQISCDVAALVDDEWIYATCDEMMDTYGIPKPEDDDWEYYGDDGEDYYDDEEEDWECNEDGLYEESNDCMDIAGDYVEGLSECEYFKSWDCETGEELSCEVAALVDEEWQYATCEEMMEMYGIPEPEDDAEDYYDEEEWECSSYEEEADCLDMVVDYIENVSECHYTEIYDCETDMMECYADVLIGEEWMSGTCEELAEFYGIPMDEENDEEWDDYYGEIDYEDEDKEWDEECMEETIEDCFDMAAEYVDGLEYCEAYSY